MGLVGLLLLAVAGGISWSEINADSTIKIRLSVLGAAKRNALIPLTASGGAILLIAEIASYLS